MVTTHQCDRLCVCPQHGTPLLYSPAFDDHACPDPSCRYAHGMAAVEQDEPRAMPPVVRTPPPKTWTCQRRIWATKFLPDDTAPTGLRREREIRECGYTFVMNNPVDLPGNVARHEVECVPAEDQPGGDG